MPPGLTAAQHYREALLNYGDLKLKEERLKDRCIAIDLWNEAAAISPLDNAPTPPNTTSFFLECYPPTPTVDPGSLVTPTPEAPTPELQPHALIFLLLPAPLWEENA